VGAYLAALSLAASASPAAASVTLGQLAPNPSILCPAPYDWAQPTVTSGNAYLVPGSGTITSWSHNARSVNGQELTMKVFRKVADPAFYMAVGHDTRPLTNGLLNTFPVSIPVKPGDVLGLNTVAGANTACYFSVPGNSYSARAGNLLDGQADEFGSGSGRLNVSAVFEPTNTFALGGAKRHQKKGTATVTVNVPNPGELALSGKGVKSAGAPGAHLAKSVPAAGKVKLLIRARGRKKRILSETGKVTVRPKFTYTPTGGDPKTKSRKLTLKKR
jgi:hypothetical protein